MATQPDQHQRLWLGLTEYAPQDWRYPLFRLKTRWANRSAHSTSPSLVPPDVSMLPERPFFGNLSACSTSEESLLTVPDRPPGTVRIGPGGPTYEKSLPNVPEICASKGRERPIEPRHVTFSVPPRKPTAKNLPNREARKYESTTTLTEEGISLFEQSLEDADSTTYPCRKNSSPSNTFGRFRPFNSQRAEHVDAVKKRERTADVATLKKSRFHPGSLVEQCRRLLHDSLNLSSFRSSRTTNGANFDAQHEHGSAETQSGKHKNLKRRTPFRKWPRCLLHGTTYSSYEHIHTGPDLDPLATPASSMVSNDEYYHCDIMGTRLDDVSFTKAKSIVADTPPHTPCMKISDPGGLAAVDAARPSSQNSPLHRPHLKGMSSEGSTVLEADRVIVEVLRRIGARVEASTKDERTSILKVTESLTREVLCICKELTSAKLVIII